MNPRSLPWLANQLNARHLIFVRETTGYAIGGIPPVGLVRPMSVWMDRDLLVYEQIWAAAGTPFAVFSIPPRELQRVRGAALVDVK
jgi:prolyl-tRNA editing enzyme YbaK/EbsC (Cys-tRNA(Pro) deacylase)